MYALAEDDKDTRRFIMSWQIDAVHTHVGFSVKHMMVSTVRGQFKQYSGTVKIDAADFTRSSFEGEVEVASIDTGNSQRDDHLRSGDFFDAANHPKIKFNSTRIDAKGDGEFVVHGNLTIRETTLPVAFDVEFHGTSKNPWGKTVSGFGAKSTVNRKDFGLAWNALLETGGVAVSDKVKIEIEVEVVADGA